MIKIQKELKTLEVPKKYEKEIIFILYNYKILDKFIEKRKNEMIEEMNVEKTVHLKSISKPNNTLEDIVIKFETDTKIKRFEQWRNIINVFLNKLYDKENKKYYYLIKYKYLENLSEEEKKKLEKNIRNIKN